MKTNHNKIEHHFISINVNIYIYIYIYTYNYLILIKRTIIQRSPISGPRADTDPGLLGTGPQNRRGA